MAFCDIDYDNLIWMNLPVRLRQAIQFSWLKALAAPAKYIYNLFSANRTENIYYLNHNSQVCYIEAALNDTFDSVLRRIYITDGADEYPITEGLVSEVGTYEPVTQGLVSEAGTYGPVTEYLVYETALEAGAGFVVHVPLATLNTLYMMALIDKYRLAGRNNYAIVTF